MSLKDLMDKSRKSGVGSPRSKGKSTGGGRTDTPPVNLTEHGGVSTAELIRAEDQVRTFPDNHPMAEYLAFLYYTLKRYRKAIEIYERLLDAEHLPAKQHFHLGNCYFQEGQVPSARMHWKRCLELQPDERTTRKARERLRSSAVT